MQGARPGFEPRTFCKYTYKNILKSYICPGYSTGLKRMLILFFLIFLLSLTLLLIVISFYSLYGEMTCDLDPDVQGSAHII